MELPVRSLDEVDGDGYLRHHWELFKKWKEDTGFSPQNSEPVSFCHVSCFFDSEGRQIDFCSIPDFARLLDADEVTLDSKSAQLRWSYSVFLKRFGKPHWCYTFRFRKSFCPEF